MGPLQGIRVVEFGGVGPAPFCGMTLADMGAEVILVERRIANPNAAGLAAQNPQFEILNRGKKSIAVDLKKPAARELLLTLVEGADVLLEGYRPGVMERLGLGPEECHAVNPRLVYSRMTGWGQYGPLSHAAGHDLNYIALSGALHYGGRDRSPPTAPATLVGDIGGGAMVMTVGILGALMHAQKTAQGQVVDTAISDGAAYATSLLYGLFKQGTWTPNRGDNVLDGAAFWYDTYECADGKCISVGALEPRFFALLMEKLGLSDDDVIAQQHDRKSWPKLKKRFGQLFRTRSRDEWCELLEGTDVCFAPVLDFEEAPEHPHNKARDVFVEVDGVLQPAPAPRLSATPAEVSAPPPTVSQHCDEILRDAGLSTDEIANLKKSEVI